MTHQEEQFAKDAEAFMRAHRSRLAAELTDTSRYPGEDEPVAVFMAGSPGAGKTETSKALLEDYPNILRIDPDEFRDLIPGYAGHNSWLVQSAVSLLVDKVFDRAIRQRQSFILDGTLSSLNKSTENIDRCVRKNRVVQILFVYQEPQQAWEFVQAREAQEGRKIPPDRFVEQFFMSQHVTQEVKNAFGPKIKVDVLLKNVDGSNKTYLANVATIAGSIPNRYSRDQVLAMIA